MKVMNFLNNDSNPGKLNNLFVGLFMLWLLTLPFGSKMGSFSVGFMTIYPNLVVGILFFGMSIKQILNWPKWLRLIALFLLIWFIYGVCYVVLTVKTPMGIFHLRSLGMQFFFASIIFNASTLFGWNNLKKYLILGFKIFLNLLIVVGLFEVFTGMHEESVQTLKFVELEVSKVFYGPIFIYENQNDFICYALFLLVILIVLDASLRASKYQLLFYAMTILFFSFVSDSVFGTMASFGLIALILFHELIKQKVSKLLIGAYSISALFLIVTIVKLPIFYGPKISNYSQFAGNRQVLVKDSLGKYELKAVKNIIPPSELNSVFEEMQSGRIEGTQYSSTTIRKNLIYSGIEFIKEEPVFGIGPGNFFNKVESKNNQYPTGTVRSPHNFVIEIVSQYGIIAWTYLIIVFSIFTFFVRKLVKEKSSQILFLIGIFPIVGILWLIPSSYLYLDINWLFLPIMICSIIYFKNSDFESEVKI